MGEGAAAGAWAGTCDGAGAGAGAGLGGGGAARCIGAEARGGEAARPLRGILALVRRVYVLALAGSRFRLFGSL